MLIKICGLTNLCDALRAVELGADFLGVIFFKRSKRYVDPFNENCFIKNYKKSKPIVGVFVNETNEWIDKVCQIFNIGYVQLHGEESPQQVQELRSIGYKVIKAHSVKNKESLSSVKKYECDYHLLDTWHESLKGGSGQSFNWELLKTIDLKNAFIAGGVGIENINDLVNSFNPFGIDLSSSLEKEPGIKDHKKMEQLFKKIDVLKGA